LPPSRYSDNSVVRVLQPDLAEKDRDSRGTSSRDIEMFVMDRNVLCRLFDQSK